MQNSTLSRSKRKDVDQVTISSRELGHDHVRRGHWHPARILSVGIWKKKSVITLVSSEREYRAQVQFANTNSERR